MRHFGQHTEARHRDILPLIFLKNLSYRENLSILLHRKVQLLRENETNKIDRLFLRCEEEESFFWLVRSDSLFSGFHSVINRGETNKQQVILQ